MLNTTILLPAYGVTYDSVEAAQKDWDKGIDFRIYGAGCYCSIRDIAELSDSFTTVYIRLINLNKSITVSKPF